MIIDINLVPTHLRKKRRTVTAKGPSSLDRKTWLFSIGGFLAVMAVVIFVLQIFIFRQLAMQEKHEKAMKGMMAQKLQVDKVIAEIKQTKEKVSSLEKILGPREIIWSRKFNQISDNLPRGLWLNRISLQGQTMLINGSALVVNQGDMINVHNYTAALKADPLFAQDFRSVEIELIKSRDISGTAVADFTIRAELPVIKPKGKK